MNLRDLDVDAHVHQPVVPTHHAPDHALLEYVTGHSEEALALGVACHVALCALCRADARRLEAVGGALLDAEPPSGLSAGALDSVLGRLDDATEEAPAPVPVSAAPAARAGAGSSDAWTSLGLPEILVTRLPPGPARWRYIAPGVRGINVALRHQGGASARLLRLKPGLVIPTHDHGAPELTLVFAGALTDAEGRFERGDLSCRQPGDTHLQRVDPKGDCIALVINADRLIPRTWAGRFIRLIARP
jgi:putative transcriptional regulator